MSGPSASVLTKNLGRETQTIIVYIVRSTLDRTLLSHFRQPVTAYTPSPTELKDRDDGESALPQFLTAACRTMMALLPPQHHHDQPKSLPTIKEDRASNTIKDFHTMKEGKLSYPKKEDRLNIRKKTNKTIGGCVRTPCPDVFCRLIEAGIIFS